MRKTAILIPIIITTAMGCIYPDTSAKQLYQDAAVKAIWQDTYHMTASPPAITWVYNSAVTETNASGYTPSDLQTWVACRLVGTGEGSSCNMIITQTQLAHELYHAACQRTTGDIDAFHSHCNWTNVDTAVDKSAKAIEPLLANCLQTAVTNADINACQFITTGGGE